MQVTKHHVVAWLRRQTDKLLVETILQAVAGRSLRPFEDGSYDSKLVLAHASRDRDLPTGWHVEFLGLPADAMPWEDEALIAQAGTHCDYEVISWAKRFTCPFCGDEGLGT